MRLICYRSFKTPVNKISTVGYAYIPVYLMITGLSITHDTKLPFRYYAVNKFQA